MSAEQQGPAEAEKVAALNRRVAGARCILESKRTTGVPPPSGAVYVGLTIASRDAVLFSAIVSRLQLRQPMASKGQFLDLIFARGLEAMAGDFGLQRRDTNHDEDG